MAREFDVALSFADCDRPTAERIANELASVDLRVFYDRWYEHEFLGDNAADYLLEVYTKLSKCVVVLVSPDYDQKSWTRFEREALQGEALLRRGTPVIVVRTRDYVPPWLPATRAFYDLPRRSLPGLILLIRRTLETGKATDAVTSPEPSGPSTKDVLDLSRHRPRVHTDGANGGKP